MYLNKYDYRNDRFVPFAAPFLFGALTGGVAAAAFNPYRPRPIYYRPPYPFYGPGFGPGFPGGPIPY